MQSLEQVEDALSLVPELMPPLAKGKAILFNPSRC